MDLILTHKDKKFVVTYDDSDHENLSQITWCIHKTKTGIYVRAGAKKDGKVYMHRFLMSAVKGEFIDHANGNGLDNRRINLRKCTREQNNQNIKCKSKLGFKGVFVKKNKSGTIFVARIGVGKKTYQLGRFEKIEEAAMAYDEAAKLYHGEFARLNFPERASA